MDSNISLGSSSGLNHGYKYRCEKRQEWAIWNKTNKGKPFVFKSEKDFVYTTKHKFKVIILIIIHLLELVGRSLLTLCGTSTYKLR